VAQEYCLGVVTDIAEVYRLGTAKAKENLDFRRYLSAHHQSDEKFHILANEVQKHVDCTACANCCRHSVVAVNDRDIERIARHLGVSVDEARRVYTVADAEASSARVLRSSREGCVFLKGTFCSIYTVRPKTCRDFPHVAAGEHSLGGRLESHARWAALCPIVYNAIEQYKHVTGFHGRAANSQQSERD
jgi:Fe-S-cluster containining protein